MFTRGYKSEPPTEKQLSYIRAIEGITGKRFVGNTKLEASQFITLYREIALEIIEIRNLQREEEYFPTLWDVFDER
jgi:hypothetical protein